MAIEQGRVPRTYDAIRREKFFGFPPVLEAEEAISYEELFAKICREIQADFIGRLLIEDVVYYSFELSRMRRLRARLIGDAVRSELASFLSPYVRGSKTENIGVRDTDEKEDPADKLARKWTAGNPAAIARVKKIMELQKLTIEDMQAHALAFHLEQFERMDRMIADLERQRNTALRELERHDFALGQRLRGKLDDVEDAEFETIDPPAPRAENDQREGDAA
jgi:hypothetical protein